MYQQSNGMKSTHSFSSIYKESFNIISSNRKLFTQITIFLTLPSSIIIALSTPLSTFLFPEMFILNLIFHLSFPNPPPFPIWRFVAFIVFELSYFVLSSGLSLLAFSSLTYSVACIYTEKTDITFKTTLCAFKKVWKKLVLTWLAEWGVIFCYSFLLGLLIMPPLLASFFYRGRYKNLGVLGVIVISMVYYGITIYISTIWIFGNTVTVLETTYGFEALSKSRSLVKGRAYKTIKVLFPISLCSGLVAWTTMNVAMNGGFYQIGFHGIGFGTRIVCGVVSLPLMVGLTVLAEVARTMTYLVCKADKGESITKSDVMDHLDIFVDGYDLLLNAKNEHI